MSSASLELFKRALAEGTNIRFQKATEPCTDTALCSDRHLEIMEKITNGTYRKPLSFSSARIKIAAAIVAAMFLLSGCVMIYKDEIRGFIEHIYEEYIEITFSDGGNTESSYIDEVYELTYVPDGYYLESKYISPTRNRYTYINSDGKKIMFDQCILDGSVFNFDIDSGCTIILSVENCNIYYKGTKSDYHYIWNNGKYAFVIDSDTELSVEDLKSIVEGIKN